MKKLIIVCEEKCRSYGDYLAQLISMDDDTDEATVGTKDGEVAAQVWTEKDYNNNEYYGAAEPPVRCDESGWAGLTEPPHLFC